MLFRSHHQDDVESAQLARRVRQGAGLVGREALAVHAGVDVEGHFESALGRRPGGRCGNLGQGSQHWSQAGGGQARRRGGG